MDRRAFLALVGASASAGMLPTRKVSPVLPPPLVELPRSYFKTTGYSPYDRQMGWMVTQEVLDDDLYGSSFVKTLYEDQRLLTHG